VLGPLLPRLLAQADGAPPPLRFVFFLQCNGINPNHVVPSGVEPRKDDKPFRNAETLEVALSGRELPEAIAPLSPFKDRMTILQGLSGRSSEGGTGGHSTNHGALGCYPGSAGPMAQTIDCALGEASPAIVRHVGLGVLEKKDQTLNPLISCAAPGKAQPLQCVPEQAFRSLFGSVLQGADRAAFANRTRVLDLMVEDVKRSRQALAGEERAKLDEYLSALETLRVRQDQVESIRPRLQASVPKLDAEFAASTEVNRLKAHVEIAAAALVAGLTNSVTIASGGGHQNYLAFPDLGIPVGGHGVGHGESCNGMSPAEIFVKTRVFHTGLLATLAAKLAGVKEGGGTMLDRTLIVYLSDSGEAHHPSLLIWPVILLGGLGGRLKPGGRYVQLPGYGAPKHRTLANLYLTLLQAAGRPRDRFGTPDLALKGLDLGGPIPELLG
jgi:hypothetical protein